MNCQKREKKFNEKSKMELGWKSKISFDILLLFVFISTIVLNAIFVLIVGTDYSGPVCAWVEKTLNISPLFLLFFLQFFFFLIVLIIRRITMKTKLTKDGAWWLADNVKVIDTFTKKEVKKILQAFKSVNKTEIKKGGVIPVTLAGHRVGVIKTTIGFSIIALKK